MAKKITKSVEKEKSFELKIGDVVQLKSGGPFMTIECFALENGVSKPICVWFKADASISKGYFHSASLKLISKN